MHNGLVCFILGHGNREHCWNDFTIEKPRFSDQDPVCRFLLIFILTLLIAIAIAIAILTPPPPTKSNHRLKNPQTAKSSNPNPFTTISISAAKSDLSEGRA